MSQVEDIVPEPQPVPPPVGHPRRKRCHRRRASQPGWLAVKSYWELLHGTLQ